MNRNLLTVTGLAVAGVILIAINVVANTGLRAAQVDLTEDKLYTLSDGTKAVLGKLDEPVALHLYYSDKLAHENSRLQGINDYYRRVRELLQQFVKYSNGKLTLELLDPEPYSEVEDKAVSLGLEGEPLPGTNDNFYFGLVGSGSTDAEQSIPFFNPSNEATLEYDLTKLVFSLAHPKKPVVGVLSTLPIEGQAPNPFMRSRETPEPWYILDVIRDKFEVKTVPPNAKEISKDIDTLLVVHPKNLPQPTLYAIDQFVLRGGRAMVFVDPFCESEQVPQDPQNPLAAMTAQRSSNLETLFDAWGVTLSKDKIAADKDAALRVPYQNSRGKQEIGDYVVYLNLDSSHMNPKEIATNQIKDVVRMLAPGVLEKKDKAETEFTPLVETSTDSMEIAVSTVQFTQDPTKLLADFASDNKKLTLAARITGKVKSAFPGGAPKDPADDANKDASKDEKKPDEPKAEHLAESKDPINVIVFADCDMLSDNAWVRLQKFGGARIAVQQVGNGALVMNALDYLTGSTDLINLRSRGGQQRPFKVVEELKKSAEQKFRAEEERLQGELDKAEQRLNELQAKKQGASQMMLSPEQIDEIKAIGQKKLETRKELRRVQHELLNDVDALGNSLQFLNIGLIPLVVIVFAIAMWFSKNRRVSAA